MTQGVPQADCQKCGAPQKPGRVICEFCSNAYSADALRHAIPCPKCKELNAWGATKCFKDQTWLVIQCLFCGNVSPHNQSACLSCGEGFQGMRERKAARDQQVQHQQTMQSVGTWGGVGATFLGSLAGSMVGGAVGSSWGSHHHSGSSWGPPAGGGEFTFGEAPPDDGGQFSFGDAPDDPGDSGDSGGGFFESVSDSFSSGDDGGGSWFD